MALVDMPLEELKRYKPRLTEKDNFNDFWKETRKISDLESLNYEMEKIDYIVKDINVYKVFYDGFGGVRICGYYLTPKKGDGAFPVILFFHGYNGNKGQINRYLKWVFLGFTVMAIDIRGQSGESTDNKVYPPPSVVGYMTKGIFSKNDYYYRSVYMDCVRAIDFLSTQETVDINRLCVAGSSQGGGLSLASASLDNRPKLVIAEMPYLCHFERAVEMAEKFENITYNEFKSIANMYPEREREMYDTLSYFDNLNLCENIKAKVFISVGLRDTCCPPSTAFAVYNHIKSEKKIDIYSFYDHAIIPMYDEKMLTYISNNL